MKRMVITLILAISVILSCTFVSSAVSADGGYIDNSGLLPKYVPDSKVTLEPSDNGAVMSPDWVKTLIVEEVNIAKASPNGKFSGMTYVLDHLAKTGVNGVWITPIYDGKHYLNYGPATVSTYLTGELDYKKGWKVVKEFVDQAHKRNIRVFFDVVTWGCNEVAPIYKEHPEWFKGYSEAYKGPLFNWENKELLEWFSGELKRIILDTGADGFRADCGIDYCGPELYKKVRSDLLAQGRKIAIIGEAAINRTQGVFDFEEHSVNIETGNLWKTGSLFTEMYSIVDSVKTGQGIGTKELQKTGQSGTGRFYSSLVSCHDSQNYIADSSLVTMGYASILSPFIPIWFIGEEWNNTYTSPKGWLYSTGIDWSGVDANRSYYENVKAMIRIRRLYPEIFEYYPDNHRDSNICEVGTDHLMGLDAYARYADGKGILVVPNKAEYNTRFSVTIPYKEMGLKTNGNYRVVNLLTGKTVAAGNASDLIGFETSVPLKYTGVYLVEAASAADLAAFKVPTVPVKNPTSPGEDNKTESKPDDVNTEGKTEQEQKNDKEDTGSKKNVQDKKDSNKTLGYIIAGAAVLVIAGVAGSVIIIKRRKKV